MANQKLLLKLFSDKLLEIAKTQTKYEESLGEMSLKSVIEPRLLMTSQNLKRFFAIAKKSHVPIELTLLFPQLVGPDDNYEQWSFIGCMITSQSDLVLEFVEPEIHKHLVIFESHPFLLYQLQGDTLCTYEYNGPRFMVYNEQKDCVKRLRIHPHNKRPSQSFLIDKPDYCDEFQPMKNLWTKKDCDKDNTLDKEELQLHFNHEFVFLYCDNQTLIVDNVTLICENKIYKLPVKKEFRAGDYHHKAEYSHRFGNITFEVYKNNIISENLLAGFEDYISIRKSLDILLQDIDQIEGHQRLTGYFGSPLFWLISLSIIAIIIILLICGLLTYLSNRKKIKSLQQFIERARI